MGATGYLGGRLTPRLAEAGHEVRCLTRRPEQLTGVAWADSVQVIRGDALDRASLDAAMAGVDVVFYLVHSIGTGSSFEAMDRIAAANTAEAAAAAGAGRIVYLGGLVPSGETASPHLASRAEVGQIFLDGPVRGGGVAGGGHHRQRIGLLRDAAVSHRAAPGDGHPQVGPIPRATHCRE